MTRVLARLPFARLVRTRRGLGTVVLFTLLALVAAYFARAHGQTSGANHVMRGFFGMLVAPLVSFSIVGTVLGGSGMKRGTVALVALGAPPRKAALACTLVAMIASAAVCAILAVLVCTIAHGATDPPLARDIPASFYVGALGGAAYAAFFAAGSAIGKGTFRAGFLVFDWLVGSVGGVGAILTPRGHVQSLLGGPLCAELPRLASSVLLFVLLAGYVGLALLLSRRPT
jgi:hypothetical protein